MPKRNPGPDIGWADDSDEDNFSYGEDDLDEGAPEFTTPLPPRRYVPGGGFGSTGSGATFPGPWRYR